MKMKATWGLFIYTGKKDPDQIFAPILLEKSPKSLLWSCIDYSVYVSVILQLLYEYVPM